MTNDNNENPFGEMQRGPKQKMKPMPDVRTVYAHAVKQEC